MSRAALRQDCKMSTCFYFVFCCQEKVLLDPSSSSCHYSRSRVLVKKFSGRTRAHVVPLVQKMCFYMWVAWSTCASRPRALSVQSALQKVGSSAAFFRGRYPAGRRGESAAGPLRRASAENDVPQRSAVMYPGECVVHTQKGSGGCHGLLLWDGTNPTTSFRSRGLNHHFAVSCHRRPPENQA
jgi:hypothetical protein